MHFCKEPPYSSQNGSVKTRDLKHLLSYFNFGFEVHRPSPSILNFVSIFVIIIPRTYCLHILLYSYFDFCCMYAFILISLSFVVLHRHSYLFLSTNCTIQQFSDSFFFVVVFELVFALFCYQAPQKPVVRKTFLCSPSQAVYPALDILSHFDFFFMSISAKLFSIIKWQQC